jgi:hypothetical protein
MDISINNHTASDGTTIKVQPHLQYKMIGYMEEAVLMMGLADIATCWQSEPFNNKTFLWQVTSQSYRNNTSFVGR